MRKYIVSAMCVMLIAPLAYLAWSIAGTAAHAQVGTAAPAAPAPAAADDTASAPCGSAIVGQMEQAMQGGGLILPEKWLQAPEDTTAVEAGLSEAARAVNAKIEAALNTPVNIDAKDEPLEILFDGLSDKHKIPIQFDAAGLTDATIRPDCHITKHLAGVTLRSALRLILDELGLKCVIHNEALLITSSAKAESDEFMTTKVYPVRDLILVRNAHGKIEADFQPLTDMMTQIVASKTWQDNGGNGTLSPFTCRGHCFLVVSQTQEVHEQIAALLAALRCAGVTGTGGGWTSTLPLPTRIHGLQRVMTGLDGMGMGSGTAGGGMGGMGGGMF